MKQYTFKKIKQLIRKRFIGFVTVQKNKRHIMQEQYKKNINIILLWLQPPNALCNFLIS